MTVRIAKSAGAVHLWLNRPQARNAMNTTMLDALSAALADAESDPAARVVVLRGAGGHFCAGGDIKDMMSARGTQAGTGPDPIAMLNARFGELALAFARSPLPIIAVVEGVVLGGGFGLACAADITLGSDTVRFALPETSLGLIPAQIAPFLAQRLGHARAQMLALTGARLGADEAYRIGLIHQRCTPDELDGRLETLLQQILRCAPRATAMTKTLFASLGRSVGSPQIEDAAVLFAEAARGLEAAEGLAAFVQKRPASWRAESPDKQAADVPPDAPIDVALDVAPDESTKAP